MYLQLIAGVVVATWAAAAGAAQTVLGTFKDWSAYTYNDSTGKMCVAAANPAESKYSQPIQERGSVFFFVTRTEEEKTRSQASTAIGYLFADNANATIEIDGDTKFTMSTTKDVAWMANTGQDAALLEAIREGDRMIVKGRSRRGTITMDTYSLAGSAAAIDRIAKECP
jgi:hypothetical protein